jgi:hypothetical protein
MSETIFDEAITQVTARYCSHRASNSKSFCPILSNWMERILGNWLVVYVRSVAAVKSWNGHDNDGIFTRPAAIHFSLGSAGNEVGLYGDALTSPGPAASLPASQCHSRPVAPKRIKCQRLLAFFNGRTAARGLTAVTRPTPALFQPCCAARRLGLVPGMHSKAARGVSTSCSIGSRCLLKSILYCRPSDHRPPNKSPESLPCP